MDRSKIQKSKHQQSPVSNRPHRNKMPQIVAVLVLLAALIWLVLPSRKTPTSQQTNSLENKPEPTFKSPPVREEVAVKPAETATPDSDSLAPKPMKLEQKVLVRSEWNSGTNAFGLDKPPDGKEGATVGPSSVAYANGNVYVLDNVNKRVLRYDKDGKLLASIALPTKGATDITTDNRGSVLVIDHYHDRIYSIQGNTAVLIGPVPMRDDFPIGTKFNYDTASNTLSAQDVDTDGLARIDGNKLTVALPDGKDVTVGFDLPVSCVEEVMTDAKGIVWVLYNLEGDYRIRRLARVDPATGSVGVAQLDVWFAFDSTRHMAPAENGVVLFAGDEREGRLVSFAYAGN